MVTDPSTQPLQGCCLGYSRRRCSARADRRSLPLFRNNCPLTNTAPIGYHKEEFRRQTAVGHRQSLRRVPEHTLQFVVVGPTGAVLPDPWQTSKRSCRVTIRETLDNHFPSAIFDKDVTATTLSNCDETRTDTKYHLPRETRHFHST